MKYAFMTFSTPNLSLDKTLEVAKAYGYEGVELRIEAGHRHGIEVNSAASQRAAARQAFATAGVEVACVATSVTFANPAETEAMVSSALASIDLASDLGSHIIRVFGGTIATGVTRAQAIELVTESLRRVADHAAERDVCVCIETHDDWTDPAHIATILGGVNHPAIAANWDMLHPVRTGMATLQESFELLRPWIRHTHIHDNVGPGVAMVPIGQGDIDYRLVVQLLRSIDYDGFLSGEWIDWEPYDVHLPREIGMLREYESELVVS